MMWQVWGKVWGIWGQYYCPYNSTDSTTVCRDGPNTSYKISNNIRQICDRNVPDLTELLPVILIALCYGVRIVPIGSQI